MPLRYRASVERFNGFAHAGVDDDFHRGRTRGTGHGATPTTAPTLRSAHSKKVPSTRCPCIRVRSRRAAGCASTATGRVLSALTGEAIPGLYASGNCSNGAAPGCYAGPGATIGPAMTFGYLAGKQVAEAVTAGA